MFKTSRPKCYINMLASYFYSCNHLYFPLQLATRIVPWTNPTFKCSLYYRFNGMLPNNSTIESRQNLSQQDTYNP